MRKRSRGVVVVRLFFWNSIVVTTSVKFVAIFEDETTTRMVLITACRKFPSLDRSVRSGRFSFDSRQMLTAEFLFLRGA